MKFRNALWIGAMAVGVAAQNEVPGVVQFDFVASKSAQHHNPKYRRMYEDILSKRDVINNTVEVTLNNEQFVHYSVDIKVGTPGQRLSLIMDTGSSDIWVISADNPYCAANEQQVAYNVGIDCNISGTFESSKSPTFAVSFDMGGFLSISFDDDTFAHGEWFTDVLSLGGITIKNMTMAIMLEIYRSQGVFGIGFVDFEEFHGYPNDDSYPNFPQRLVTDGYTAHAAYSIWLNDLYAPNGSILFGGVDHAKYNPPLLTVPIVRSIKAFYDPVELTIVMDSMTAGTKTILEGPVIALIDSGTAFMALPSDAVNALVELFDADYDQTYGLYLCKCFSGSDDGNLTFDFSGALIEVPYSQFLYPLISTSSGHQLTLNSGEPACVLAAQEVSPKRGKIVLGDAFLRSAYVVYDLENYEISLAQIVANTTDSDIEAILSTVPSASLAPRYNVSATVSIDTDSRPTEDSSSSLSSETGSSSGSGTSSNSGTKHSVGLIALLMSGFVFGILL